MEMFFKHNYARRVIDLQVVYIEYHDGIPHDVICSHEGFCYYFDFEKSCYSDESIMYFHSGAGGSIKEIQAPQYAEGCTGTYYWMHDTAAFSKQYSPKNITKLDAPFQLMGTEVFNPFDEKISHEIYGMNYCNTCNKWYDEDGCDEHHVWDEDEAVFKNFDGTEA